MDTMNTKSLWGEEFRVVDQGLAEVDVVRFVERLLTRHRVAEQRVSHLTSLNELATKTVESAEQLARDIKDDAERAAAQQSAAIVADAEQRAREIIDDAARAGAAIQAEAILAAEERVRDLESTLSVMAQWPEEELQAIAETEQRIRSFRGTFEGLLDLLKARLDVQSMSGTKVSE